MYVTSYNSQMGCSVKELAGFYAVPTQEELVNKKGVAATLCVTTGNDAKKSAALKKAGFILLADYKNYAMGHGGTPCKLWGSFGPRSKAKLLPGSADIKKLVTAGIRKKLAAQKKLEEKKTTAKVVKVKKATTKKKTAK